MNIATKVKTRLQNIKQAIIDDQPLLKLPTPEPVKGEPAWVTKVHQLQQYDFRTGKRNDGRDE